MNLELSYGIQTKNKLLKKCSICSKPNGLIKLPDEFQEHAAKKGFISYYCSNCLQVVNFCI